jgi:putative addiction module killer protein
LIARAEVRLRRDSTISIIAAAKVTTAMVRLSLGNMSNVRSVGAGVFETKIAFGPGYRIYFGKDGESVVILLGGGTKQRQQQDIMAAQERWQDYKDRKTARMRGKL